MSANLAPADRVWMNTAQTADYLGVSVVTVKRHILSGALRSSQAVPGGRHLIHRDWADDWAMNRRNLPQPLVRDGRRDIA